MNSNQLDLLNRKLEQIISPSKITVIDAKTIRINNTDFEFSMGNSTSAEQQVISTRTVTSR
ncbi:MAG: hypothetical protein ACO3UU_10670 [Minisyncoccia bacterium]